MRQKITAQYPLRALPTKYLNMLFANTFRTILTAIKFWILYTMASAQIIPVRASCSLRFMILWDIKIAGSKWTLRYSISQKHLTRFHKTGCCRRSSFMASRVTSLNGSLSSSNIEISVRWLRDRGQAQYPQTGVPQGTVLDPLLFLLHINDLPSVISSQVRLFIDDCLMYCPIESRGDQVDFQSHLDAPTVGRCMGHVFQWEEMPYYAHQQEY